MRKILVSDPVWNAIAQRGRFGETEDDVLRRVFSINGKATGDSQQTQPKRSPPGRGNKRLAKKRMSPRIENRSLIVEFPDEGVHDSWSLPERSNKPEIRKILEQAVAFAKENGASVPGQINHIRKTLTDAGYHLRG